MESSKNYFHLHLISDSTGETLIAAGRAAAAQFQSSQALLNTRDHRSDGMVAVQDLAPIFQSKEVRQIHAYLVTQNGRKAMSEAEHKRDRLLDQMAYQAQALVKERFPTIH